MRPIADAHPVVALVTLARGNAVRDGCPNTALPHFILKAGERAAFHSLEFITARIANPHTRAAYGRAIAEFCGWCEERGLSLPALSSPSSTTAPGRSAAAMARAPTASTIAL